MTFDLSPAGLHRKGAKLKWLRQHVTCASDECVLWPFPRNEDGYGTLHYDGKTQKAHRVMCRWVHGEPPHPALGALHSCQNGRNGCINAKHLRWGTPKDNAADRARDGTETCGSDVWSARLTVEDVVRIKERVAGGEMQKDVADDFGIHRSHVSKIMSGRKWALALASGTRTS